MAQVLYLLLANPSLISAARWTQFYLCRQMALVLSLPQDGLSFFFISRKMAPVLSLPLDGPSFFSAARWPKF